MALSLSLVQGFGVIDGSFIASNAVDVSGSGFYNNAEGNAASSGAPGSSGCDVPITGNGNTDGGFTAAQIAKYNSIVAGVGL
ncbi:hypothetical protein WJX74_004515 [Apatococcus lobatus]|uniref:Uncharacterized protein n=1 Tax=Apatococcus lobatus TaxID=904363 RepID=A0AAW1SGE6_9CHLO